MRKAIALCCVAFNAGKTASRYSALRRKTIEPLPASIVTPTQFYRTEMNLDGLKNSMACTRFNDI